MPLGMKPSENASMSLRVSAAAVTEGRGGAAAAGGCAGDKGCAPARPHDKAAARNAAKIGLMTHPARNTDGIKYHDLAAQLSQIGNCALHCGDSSRTSPRHPYNRVRTTQERAALARGVREPACVPRRQHSDRRRFATPTTSRPERASAADPAGEPAWLGVLGRDVLHLPGPAVRG